MSDHKACPPTPSTPSPTSKDFGDAASAAAGENLLQQSCLSTFEHGAPLDLPGSAPVLDWSALSRADHVRIYENGVCTALGRIDVLSTDGNVLWLQANGADGRRLFLRSDVTIYKGVAADYPLAGQ